MSSYCQLEKKNGKVVAKSALANIEARFKKKSNKVSNTSDLIKKFEREEDCFLRNVEKLQKRRMECDNSRSFTLNQNGATSTSLGQVKSTSKFIGFKSSKIPTSLISKYSKKSAQIVTPNFTTEFNGCELGNQQRDLLGSFCQIIQHITRLRRENEHLKRQVMCLREMRQIEQLRNELLQKDGVLLCANCGNDAALLQPNNSPGTKMEDKKPLLGDTSKNNSSAGNSYKLQQVLPGKVLKVLDKSRRNSTKFGLGHESNLSSLVQTKGDTEKAGNVDDDNSANLLLNAKETKFIISNSPISSWVSSKNSSTSPLPRTACGRFSYITNNNLKYNCHTSNKNTQTKGTSISISIESASEQSSKTPEDPSISRTASWSNTTASSLPLMSRSLSYQQPVSQTNNLETEKKGNESRWLTIPKRSTFERYGLKSMNRQSVRLSAEEAMIEPSDLISSQLLTNTARTYGTSADFSADSMFSLLETVATNPISNNTDAAVVQNMQVQQFVENSDKDDDQVSIFAEVQLPDLKEKSKVRSQHIVKRFRKSLQIDNSNKSICDVTTTENSSALSYGTDLHTQPKNRCLSYTNSLLEKFGLKSSAKNKLGADASDSMANDKNLTQTCRSFVYVPKGQDCDGAIGIARAIVRKRKRKISETDSIASSEDGSHILPQEYPHNHKDASTLNNGFKESSSNMEENVCLSENQAEKLCRYHPRIPSVVGAGVTIPDSKMDVKEQDNQVNHDDHVPLDHCTEMNEKRKTAIFFPDESSAAKSGLQDPSPLRKAMISLSSKIDSRPQSYLNLSNDSVFVTENGEQGVNGTVSDFSNVSGCTDLTFVRKVFGLQRKNSALIKTLRDKTEECDQITGHLASLEGELTALRNRCRLDSHLDKIRSDLISPAYVPATMMGEMQDQMHKLDASIRQVKDDALKSQQLVMDSFVKEQGICRKYLDQIENLQKQNLQLMQRTCNDALSDRSMIQQNVPKYPHNYDTLCKYTANTVKKLQQLRFRLLERICCNTQLNLELVQTQSSLLLAHAQIQRQKVEIDLLQSTKRHLRRPESFHGQDLLFRNINNRISFYLPFKLHGDQNYKGRKPKESSEHDLQDILLYDEGQELAFMDNLRVIENTTDLLESRPKFPFVPPSPVARCLKRYQHDRPNSYSDYRHLRLREKPLNSFGSSSPSNNSTMSFNQNGNNRPSSLIWQENLAARDRRSFYESNLAFHNVPPVESDFPCIKEQSPLRSTSSNCRKENNKIPQPIRLGNQGQVRSLAAVFNRQTSHTSTSSQRSCTNISSVSCSKAEHNWRLQDKWTMINSLRKGDAKTSKIPIKNNQENNAPSTHMDPAERSYETLKFQPFNHGMFSGSKPILSDKSSSPDTTTIVQNVARMSPCYSCKNFRIQHSSNIHEQKSSSPTNNSVLFTPNPLTSSIYEEHSNQYPSPMIREQAKCNKSPSNLFLLKSFHNSTSTTKLVENKCDFRATTNAPKANILKRSADDESAKKRRSWFQLFKNKK